MLPCSRVAARRLAKSTAGASKREICRWLNTLKLLRHMLKKTIICILSLAALSGLASAQEAAAKAIDREKAALIEEMMSLTHPDKMLAQFLQQYKIAFSKGFEESFRNQMSKRNQDPTKYQPKLHRFEDQMFDLMADRMNWEKMKPKFAVIYDETFSKQELADIVAFYKTSSGQSLLQKMPVLMTKGSQVGQAQMGGAVAEIQKLTEGFIADLEETNKGSANQ